MTDLRKGIKNAQQQGIDVGQVVRSYAKHLTDQRRKVRDNPRSLEGSAPPSHYNPVVTESRTATGVRWRSIGGVPSECGELTITGSTHEAAKNKTSLRALLEQRFRAELASALQRAGVYQTDLAGRRAAMAVAIASPISVVDLADVGEA